MLRVDGGWFPDDKWNDFPLVILSWWLDDIFRLLSTLENSAVCKFMDGLFAFRLSRDKGDVWSIGLIDNEQEHRISAVDGIGLAKSMLAAAQELIDECWKRGWVDADVDNLREVSKQVNLYFSKPAH